MTEREKMLSGMLYNPLDRELSAQRLRARLLCQKYSAMPYDEFEKKNEILRELFGKCGEGVFVETGFKCDYGCNIELGDNVYINFDCVILDCAKVKIGSNCLIAPQVGIYAATHTVSLEERQAGLELARKIEIGDNCWLGGGCVICPGVRLGNNVVVAAGSVVTKSFGSNVVIGGNPARIIRENI